MCAVITSFTQSGGADIVDGMQAVTVEGTTSWTRRLGGGKRMLDSVIVSIGIAAARSSPSARLSSLRAASRFIKLTTLVHGVYGMQRNVFGTTQRLFASRASVDSCASLYCCGGTGYDARMQM